jgi:hypothetical protein
VPEDQGGKVISPVERCGFTGTTSYDTLQRFLRELSRYPSFHVKEIARSRAGRSVNLVTVRNPGDTSSAGKLRFLLFAQQHGDEPSGKEALTLLLAQFASGDLQDVLTDAVLYIVPQMNPDGAELYQRRTTDSLDLNRSHVLLNSPETAGLHRLFLDVRPQVTVDIHEYGATDRSWSDSGFIKRGDVQLGMLTNLNSSAEIRRYQRDSVFPSVARRMASAGYTFHEYIVGSPRTRIRHSTTEINDGRQSFGILNALSFIQEGRQGVSLEGDLERRSRSQLTAIQALVSYCVHHAGEISGLVEHEQQLLEKARGSVFALRMEHVPGPQKMWIPVHSVVSGRDTSWEVQPYHSVVRSIASTTVPSAYVIPRECTSIIGILREHQVKLDVVQNDVPVNAEAYQIDSVGFDVLEEDSLPRPFVTKQSLPLVLRSGDVVASTAQWHSLFLATVLEPESIWGLTKYPGFSWLLTGKRYPVVRIP